MLNLENFLSFAREQSGTVDLTSNFDCAIAQFLKAQGYPNPSVGGWNYRPDRNSSEYLDIPENIHEPVGVLMNERKSDPVTWAEIVAKLEKQDV